MRTSAAFLAPLGALALATAAAAQDAGASRPAAAPRTPLRIASGEKSASSPASRPVESVYHTRIKVLLKNGQKILGIAKQNRMSERAEGFDFFPADRKDESAGIRIWYASLGQNYVFIPYKEIALVEETGRVSDLEVKAIEAKLEEEIEAQRRKEEDRLSLVREKRAEKKAEEQKSEREVEEAKKKAEAAELKAKKEKAQKILDRYPPDAGWGLDKKKEILTKKTNHIYPSPEEMEFLALFPEWAKAKLLLHPDDAGNADLESEIEKAEKNSKGKKEKESEG